MSVTPIHTFSHEEAQRIFAWARYVFWAEVECQQYNAHVPAENESPIGIGTVLMVQFYAALWVAVEGWRECPLSDETVDDLLDDPAFQQNVQLLRRFRNGVYHYQSDLLNERLLGFLREGEHAVTWAFLLHDEFKRVIWEMAHPVGISSEFQVEFADAIHGIVGWIPKSMPEATSYEANEQFLDVISMILKNGTRNTTHAKELLDAVNHARVVACEASWGWTQQKRAMIEALKKKKRPVPDDAT